MHFQLIVLTVSLICATSCFRHFMMSVRGTNRRKPLPVLLTSMAEKRMGISIVPCLLNSVNQEL